MDTLSGRLLKFLQLWNGNLPRIAYQGSDQAVFSFSFNASNNEAKYKAMNTGLCLARVLGVK